MPKDSFQPGRQQKEEPAYAAGNVADASDPLRSNTNDH
jgi:hypothetical protein